MTGRGVETLLLFAPTNIFYLTGLTGYNTVGYTNFQCLAVRVDGDPVLAVRLLERPVAEATTRLRTILTYEDHEDPAAAVWGALHDMGLAGRDSAAEQTSPFLSVREYSHLEEILGARLLDGSGIVEEVRLVKSPRELEYLRTAARSTEAGMRALLGAIAPGKTENEVIGECYRAMVTGGSEFFSSGPILTSGTKSGIAHTTFHRRRRPQPRGVP
jgi:Xaa-Pro dipeptidase